MILINNKEKALVDSVTGDIFKPTCFDTLAPYYSYLVTKGHYEAAQRMLHEVIKGEKFISKMIDNAQKHNIDSLV